MNFQFKNKNHFNKRAASDEESSSQKSKRAKIYENFYDFLSKPQSLILIRKPRRNKTVANSNFIVENCFNQKLSRFVKSQEKKWKITKFINSGIEKKSSKNDSQIWKEIKLKKKTNDKNEDKTQMKSAVEIKIKKEDENSNEREKNRISNFQKINKKENIPLKEEDNIVRENDLSNENSRKKQFFAEALKLANKQKTNFEFDENEQKVFHPRRSLRLKNLSQVSQSKL